jgi:L,D-transpeptidase catalytic domain
MRASVRHCGVVLVCALVMLAAACGGTDRAERPQSPSAQAGRAVEFSELGDLSRVSPQLGQECEPGVETKLRTRKVAFAAVVHERVVALAHPAGRKLRAFGRYNDNDFPTVFGVLAAVLDRHCQPAWYRVQLPMRPNGATGYVRAASVELFRVSTRIEIDLSERRVEFFDAGKRVLRAKAAIGAAITPTPTGSFYVNQRLTTREVWGPFGPAAIGISAFSPVLQDWVQGGPIAIHGTNDPGSVGRAVSHGCLRIANDVLVRLFEHTPAGTPVTIRA